MRKARYAGNDVHHSSLQVADTPPPLQLHAALSKRHEGESDYGGEELFTAEEAAQMRKALPKAYDTSTATAVPKLACTLYEEWSPQPILGEAPPVSGIRCATPEGPSTTLVNPLQTAFCWSGRGSVEQAAQHFWKQRGNTVLAFQH